MIDKNCTVEDCNRNIRAKKLCGMHYERERSGRDALARSKEFHGMSKSPEYNSWSMMINRCENIKADDYQYYGGRGISIYPEWRASFIAFLAYMGEREEGLTIERIDNNGNYEPGNCKWATRLEQANNQGIKISNNSGVTGVGRSKIHNNWRARIAYNNKDYYLGSFRSFFDACCARKSAELRILE